MNPCRTLSALCCLFLTPLTHRGMSSRRAIQGALGVIPFVVLLAMASAGWTQTVPDTFTSGPSIGISNSGQIQDMKLLRPGVGWALQQNRLYWTQDDGKSWKEITPETLNGDVIASVFFLDNGAGWILLSGPKQDSDLVQSATLLQTKDFGDHWTQLRANILQLPDISEGAMPASLFFADSTNGWLTLRLPSGSAFSFGQLLGTQDGGASWSVLSDLPSFGAIHFLTRKQGWLVGGPDAGSLWKTLDGGVSWTEIQVPTPADCEECRIRYSLPAFSGDRTGVLAVTFAGSEKSRLNEYASSDGGKTWQETGSAEASTQTASSTAIAYANSHAIRLSTREEGGIETSTKGGILSASLPGSLWPRGSIRRAQFVNEEIGWAIYTAGRCLHLKSDCSQQNELLSTSDSGATFTQIGPRLPKAEATPMFETKGIPFVEEANPEAGMRGDASQAIKTGFDASTQPSVPTMLTWVLESPYYDIGIYLGGDNRADRNRDGTDISASNLVHLPELSAQGWGLFPIWVGPQSECVDVAYKKDGTPNFNFMSDSGLNGTEDAKKAVTALQMAMKRFPDGTPGVIYFDLEPYNCSLCPKPNGKTYNNPTCSSEVKTFLSNWVNAVRGASTSQMPIKAGVYFNHRQSNLTDMENIPAHSQPDAVWITEWDGYKTLNEADFNSWPMASFGRISQYSQNTYEAYGGSPSIEIDGDALEAPIIPWTSANDFGPPMMTYPSSNATGVPTMPTFKWSAVSGAPGYRIMVVPSAYAGDLPSLPGQGGTVPSGSGMTDCPHCVINPPQVIGNTYTVPPSNALQAGQSYTWQVHALGDGTSAHYYGLWPSAPYSFTVAAQNPATYALTVSKTGTGTVSSSDGHINCGSSCNYSYNSGTSVTLTAAPTSGWSFSTWGGACSGAGSCVVSMTSAKSVSATFTQNPATYALTVTKTGTGMVNSSDGHINCGSSCNYSYNSGTPVTLSAAPASGWSFSTWGGACSGAGSCVVSMTSARSVSATFTQIPATYALTVTKTGTGTVTSNDGHTNCGSTCSYKYSSGASVTLTAAPASGWSFSTWGGSCSGAGSCVVSMTSAKSVSATFTQITAPSAPTLISPGGGSSPGPTINNLYPTFSWGASNGATNYGLYVRDVTTGVLVYSNNSVGNVTSTPLAGVTLIAGHSYRWNMVASNSAGASGVTPLFYFQEQPAVPAPPTLYSPGNGSSPGPTINNLYPTFSWGGSNGATNYGLYVRDVTTGALIYSNNSVGNITSTPLAGVTLTAGHSYRWNMVASNSAGTSDVTPLFYLQEQAAGCGQTFCPGDIVMVYGSPLNLRTCASTSCGSIVVMPIGTSMQVIGGPSVSGSITWWNLSGYPNGVFATGWASGAYLKK